MQFPAIPGSGLVLALVGGPSPILAEGLGRSSPPFLARVCCLLWWVVPRQSWRRALRVLFPGWGLLLALVGSPSPVLAEGPGRGSPPFLAGVRW